MYTIKDVALFIKKVILLVISKGNYHSIKFNFFHFFINIVNIVFLLNLYK